MRAAPTLTPSRFSAVLGMLLVAAITALAPFTHLTSASVAPIVHEDGGAKSPTTASATSVATRRRRGRTRGAGRHTWPSLLPTSRLTTAARVFRGRQIFQLGRDRCAPALIVLRL